MSEEHKESDYTGTNITNILSYGSPAAKLEVLVKLIYIGNIDVLEGILASFTDAEYYRIIPCA